MTPDELAAALTERLRRRGVNALPEDVRSFTADIGQCVTGAPDLDQWADRFNQARQPDLRLSSDNPSLGSVPRILAVFLALGGCFWGLLLAPWVFQPGVSPSALLDVGPGYLVTAAYIVRSLCTPPLWTRRVIWVASLLVQGTWLAWAAWAIAEKVLAGRTVSEPALPVLWWLFATAASAVGLLTERRKPAKRDATTNNPPQ
jgi:hypothetical protein